MKKVIPLSNKKEGRHFFKFASFFLASSIISISILPLFSNFNNSFKIKDKWEDIAKKRNSPLVLKINLLSGNLVGFFSSIWGGISSFGRGIASIPSSIYSATQASGWFKAWGTFFGITSLTLQIITLIIFFKKKRRNDEAILQLNKERESSANDEIIDSIIDKKNKEKEKENKDQITVDITTT